MTLWEISLYACAGCFWFGMNARGTAFSFWTGAIVALGFACVGAIIVRAL